MAAHSDAAWNPAGFLHRVSAIPDGQVAVISGGGSGHEPMHSGFLEEGMLAAVCPGHLFTSPNADQISEATRWASNQHNSSATRGVLYVVKNYTGDVMNFNVAARLNPDLDIATVVVKDDIATDFQTGPGRRGTAATILVEKVAGAAAQCGDDLETVRRQAQWVVDNSRSIAVALAPGYLPTTDRDTFDLPHGEMELGVGIHGEPGISREKAQSAHDVVERILPRIVEALGIKPGDQVICLTNGLGGTTLLEIHLVFGEVLKWLEQRGVAVCRSLNGSFVTAVNMRGISIALARCTDDILELIDAPTMAPGWPRSIEPAMSQPA